MQTLSSKQALVFVVSDFLAPLDVSLWRSLQYKKDIIAIRCVDPQEKVAGAKALVWMKDTESDESMLVSLGSSSIDRALDANSKDISEFFKKAGIDSLELSTKNPFVEQIIAFFQRKKLSQ